MSGESCPRLGRWIGGCRWRARYDETKSHGAGDAALWAAAIGKMAPQPEPSRKTYLGDVCETCGAARWRRKLEPKL